MTCAIYRQMYWMDFSTYFFCWESFFFSSRWIKDLWCAKNDSRFWLFLMKTAEETTARNIIEFWFSNSICIHTFTKKNWMNIKEFCVALDRLIIYDTVGENIIIYWIYPDWLMKTYFGSKKTSTDLCRKMWINYRKDSDRKRYHV